MCDNGIYLTILKVDTMMLMCVEKKSANVLAKNMVQYI